MIVNVLVARVVDGLPLAASVESASSSDLTDESMVSELQRQAKALVRQGFTPSSPFPLPSQCSIFSASERYVFHLITADGVCYLASCERTYARVLAYSFLAELKDAFVRQYSNSDIQAASRPYPFIRFESVLTQLQKRYSNTRTLQTSLNLAEISSKLQSVPTVGFQDVVVNYTFEPDRLKRGKGSMQRLNQHQAAPVATAPASRLGALTANKLDLAVLLCWIFIAFYNFTFDLWFGLGVAETSSVAPSPDGDYSMLHSHTPTLLKLVALIYAMCGGWVLLQVWLRIMPLKQQRPSCCFPHPTCLVMHAALTLVFVFLIVSAEQSLFFYTYYQQGAVPPKEPTMFLSSMMRLDLCVYWLYVALALVRSMRSSQSADSFLDHHEKFS